MIKKYNLTFIFFFIAILLTVGCSQKATENTAKEKSQSLSKAYDGMFKIGVAINRAQAGGHIPQATPLIVNNFNSITPENVLKWSRVQPQPDKYNFGPADQYVAFGEKHDMFILGHNLVWHTQIPDWTFVDENGNQLDREALLQRMKDHISTVVGHYKGRIDAWDVVNEAAGRDGLRKSKWYKIIGKDYIDKAFQYAHEADPDAELYYNDYNLWAPAKRQTVVKMVKRLQKNKVPIDGIGMQAHIGLDNPPIKEIEKSINAFSKLGVKVMITELDVSVLPSRHDVNISYSPGDGDKYGDVPPKLNPYTEELPDSVQQQLTERYVQLFELLKKHKDQIDRVTFWGLDDGHSWLNNFPIPGRTNYPLLFNRSYEPKSAFYGILKVANS